MKRQLFKAFKLLFSVIVGASIFALFLWKGIWVTILWVIVAMASCTISAVIYGFLSYIDSNKKRG